MARRARKLPVASARGTPDITMGDADWQRIESAYGAQLSDGVHAAVVEATKEFVRWEVFERTAEPVADSQKWIRSLKRLRGIFKTRC